MGEITASTSAEERANWLREASGRVAPSHERIRRLCEELECREEELALLRAALERAWTWVHAGHSRFVTAENKEACAAPACQQITAALAEGGPA